MGHWLHDSTVATPPLVLVVDDDDDIRALLHRYLTREGWAVALAADTTEAESILGLLVPEVAVLDIMMPGESGIQFARRLRRSDNRLPLLLLSAKGAAEDRIEGLEAGASDYLAKPFDPRELLLRLRNLVGPAPSPQAPPSAAAPMAGTYLRIGSYRWTMPGGPLMENETPVHLTEMEQKLLVRLAASPNQLIRRETLQAEFGGAERQVDVLVARLRRKIGADRLHTVRGHGYRLQAAPDTSSVTPPVARLGEEEAIPL